MNRVYIAFIALFAHASFASAQLNATTAQGLVQGFYSGNARTFLGIPYASPPVGPLRFLPPVAPVNYTGSVFNATNYSSPCAQPYGSQSFGLNPGSEDCLYLNVWAPQNASTTPYPVMVFVHGGGFTYGSGQLYNGSFLVQSNIIVVTFNYRLGVFGFAAQNTSYGFPANATNIGVRDQQFAFAWVKNNIAAFGGDPNQITVQGHSAGGTSIFLHLTIPSSYPLYNRLIAESPLPGWFVRSFEYEQNLTSNVSITAGCPQTDATRFSCLQGLSTAQLIAAEGTSFYYAYPDGSFVVDYPLHLMNNGTFNRNAPLLVGNNAQEGSLFAYSTFNQTTNGTVSDFDYNNAIASYNEPSILPIVQQVYDPLRNTGAGSTSNNWAIFALQGQEQWIGCGVEQASVDFIAYSAQNLYRYNFAHVPQLWSLKILGSTHLNELQYIYQSSVNLLFPLDSNDLIVSEQFRTYWTNFVKSGNPNTGSTNLPTGAVTWPTFSPSRQELVIDVQSFVSGVEVSPRCQIWANVYAGTTFNGTLSSTTFATTNVGTTNFLTSGLTTASTTISQTTVVQTTSIRTTGVQATTSAGPMVQVGILLTACALFVVVLIV